MVTQVERTFQPGQVANAMVTIANDGTVATRYAMEVAPGVTRPFVGFITEGTAVFLTDVIQPEESSIFRIPLALPPEISEGGKVIRVRIGEAGPAGELVTLLDEQEFPGFLRVRALELPEEVPIEPPGPEPPMPLPGEVITGRILDVEIPELGQELEGGDRATVRVTYENTGNTPHVFSVIAWAGELTVLADIRPDVQGSIRGPIIQPGDHRTLSIPLDLPREPDQGFGRKDVLVLLADLDPTGRFPTVTYDTFAVPGAFTLMGVPTEIIPVIPPAGFIPEFGDVTLSFPTVQPSEARPGDEVRIGFTLTNIRIPQEAAALRIQTAILDDAGSSVATIAPVDLVPAPGVTQPVSQVVQLPATVSPGLYRGSVEVYHQATSILLARALPPFSVLEALEIVPPGVTGLFPGDLALLDPTVSPTAAFFGPGDQVTISLPFDNFAAIAPPVTMATFILEPDTNNIVASLTPQTFSPQPGPPTTRDVTWTVPETAVDGRYGLRVMVWDPNTLVARDITTYLIREDLLGLFRVVIPEVVPAEIVPPEEIVPPVEVLPEEVLPTALVPGDLDMLAITVTPAVASPGDLVIFNLPFSNLGQIAPSLTMSLDILDPQGNRSLGGRLPWQTFSPQPGETTYRTAEWRVPEEAVGGLYAIRVMVWDPNTLLPDDITTYLIREEQDFEVELPVVVEPPAEVVPPVRRIPTLSRPVLTFNPESIPETESSQVTFSITNGSVPQQIFVVVSLIGPTGVETGLFGTAADLGPSEDLINTYELSPSLLGLRPGTYAGRAVVSSDPAGRSVLQDERVGTVTVQADPEYQAFLAEGEEA